LGSTAFVAGASAGAGLVCAGSATGAAFALGAAAAGVITGAGAGAVCPKGRFANGVARIPASVMIRAIRRLLSIMYPVIRMHAAESFIGRTGASIVIIPSGLAVPLL
jgi:hypothetical protein